MLTTQTILIYYLPCSDQEGYDRSKKKCDEFKTNFNLSCDVLPSYTGQEGYVPIQFEQYIPIALQYPFQPSWTPIYNGTSTLTVPNLQATVTNTSL